MSQELPPLPGTEYDRMLRASRIARLIAEWLAGIAIVLYLFKQSLFAEIAVMLIGPCILIWIIFGLFARYRSEDEPGIRLDDANKSRVNDP